MSFFRLATVALLALTSPVPTYGKKKPSNKEQFKLLKQCLADPFISLAPKNPDHLMCPARSTHLKTGDINTIGEAQKTYKERKIILIGQMHVDRTEQDDKVNQLYSQDVFETQHKILKKLSDLKPKHIFLEGVSQTLHKNAGDPFLRKEIQELFSKGIPKKLGSLTKAQKNMLKGKDGAVVYAYLNNDVTLHKSQTNAAKEALEKMLERNSHQKNNGFMMLTDPNDMKLLTDNREKDTADLVKKFLRKHPDKKIAIVYGARHINGFRRLFLDKAYKPYVSTIDFTPKKYRT